MNFIELKNRIENYIRNNLKEERLKHTYSVANEARNLALYYGEDGDKAYLTALFHDMCRNMSAGSINMYVRHLGLPASYMNNANLAHSKIAAEMMANDYHICDEDMINAVSYHTTGRAGMSKLEKIIFLADAIEPDRNYPRVDEIRKLAYEDLDRACICSLERTIEYIEARGDFLDSDTVSARDYLKK